jgi:hypothetical protein
VCVESASSSSVFRSFFCMLYSRSINHKPSVTNQLYQKKASERSHLAPRLPASPYSTLPFIQSFTSLLNHPPHLQTQPAHHPHLTLLFWLSLAFDNAFSLGRVRPLAVRSQRRARVLHEEVAHGLLVRHQLPVSGSYFFGNHTQTTDVRTNPNAVIVDPSTGRPGERPTIHKKQGKTRQDKTTAPNPQPPKPHAPHIGRHLLERPALARLKQPLQPFNGIQGQRLRGEIPQALLPPDPLLQGHPFQPRRVRTVGAGEAGLPLEEEGAALPHPAQGAPAGDPGAEDLVGLYACVYVCCVLLCFVCGLVWVYGGWMGVDGVG